ncbi:protein kinase, partial [bacterium]
KRSSNTDYYSFLRHLVLTKKISAPNELNHLNNYFTYLHYQDKLNHLLLITELNEIEHRLLISASINYPKLHNLFIAKKYIKIIEKLLFNRLTQKEFESYLTQKSHIIKFFETSEKYFSVSDISKHISNMENFYRLSNKRDEYMVNNLLKAKKSNHYILLAGGYHKKGITQILRNRDISYSVIEPKINSSNSNSLYLKRISEQAKWMKPNNNIVQPKTYLSANTFSDNTQNAMMVYSELAMNRQQFNQQLLDKLHEAYKTLNFALPRALRIIAKKSNNIELVSDGCVLINGYLYLYEATDIAEFINRYELNRNPKIINIFRKQNTAHAFINVYNYFNESLKRNKQGTSHLRILAFFLQNNINIEKLLSFFNPPQPFTHQDLLNLYDKLLPFLYNLSTLPYPLENSNPKYLNTFINIVNQIKSKKVFYNLMGFYTNSNPIRQTTSLSTPIVQKNMINALSKETNAELFLKIINNFYFSPRVIIDPQFQKTIFAMNVLFFDKLHKNLNYEQLFDLAAFSYSSDIANLIFLNTNLVPIFRFIVSDCSNNLNLLNNFLPYLTIQEYSKFIGLILDDTKNNYTNIKKLLTIPAENPEYFLYMAAALHFAKEISLANKYVGFVESSGNIENFYSLLNTELKNIFESNTHKTEVLTNFNLLILDVIFKMEEKSDKTFCLENEDEDDFDDENKEWSVKKALTPDFTIDPDFKTDKFGTLFFNVLPRVSHPIAKFGFNEKSPGKRSASAQVSNSPKKIKASNSLSHDSPPEELSIIKQKISTIKNLLRDSKVLTPKEKNKLNKTLQLLKIIPNNYSTKKYLEEAKIPEIRVSKESPSKRKIYFADTPYTFTNFSKEDSLGQGTYGAVKKVQDSNGNTYALKILNLDNQKNTHSFIKEIQIMSELSGTSFSIPLLKYGYAVENLGGTIPKSIQLYLLMPIAKSDLLISTTAQNSKPQIFAYIMQSIRILELMHKRGYVHNDIKLNNILLNSKYQLLLTDFGLSSQMGIKEDRTFNQFGTYIPPEALKYRKAAKYTQTGKCDIWSLGFSIFTLISSRFVCGEIESIGDYKLPFQDKIIEALKKQSSSKENLQPNLRQIPFQEKITQQIQENLQKYIQNEQLRDLLKQMLAANPDERLSINEVITHPWVDQYYPTTKYFFKLEDYFDENHQEYKELTIESLSSKALKILDCEISENEKSNWSNEILTDINKLLSEDKNIKLSEKIVDLDISDFIINTDVNDPKTILVTPTKGMLHSLKILKKIIGDTYRKQMEELLKVKMEKHLSKDINTTLGVLLCKQTLAQTFIFSVIEKFDNLRSKDGYVCDEIFLKVLEQKESKSNQILSLCGQILRNKLTLETAVDLYEFNSAAKFHHLKKLLSAA